MEGTERAQGKPASPPAPFRLTERETEILRLIFEGGRAAEVARTLRISKRTVDFHLARAYVKLGASNRGQAFRRAVDLGIIAA
ncbi:MAG: LuxR C-terminal-related transcriptional regulator [Armatimonadota bacterium]